MQPAEEEVLPSGQTGAEEPQDPAVQKSEAASEDQWGKFYSMPPKWTKDDREGSPSSQSHLKLSDENIGHKLASLLRYHLGENNGISNDENGWVLAVDVIEHGDEVGLRGVTAEDLIRVAESNEHSTRGKRFESDGAGRIKAAYRHPPRDPRDRWERDSRQSRGGRSRGYNDGYQERHSSGWHDWKDGGWQDWGNDDTWSQWKKPGFSPSPDDTIVKASTWTDATEADNAVKPIQAEADQTEAAAKGADSQAETIASDNDAACEWEQWFTPEDMEMYFYNTQTEETFFPGDAADCEEKGWSRYADAEGEKEGKIYWWHEATSRSFYEEHAIGDVAEA